MQNITKIQLATIGFMGVGVLSSGANYAQSQNANPVVTPAERKAAQNNPVISGKETNADKMFLKMALQQNMLGMQTAQLALKQSKSPDIQDSAQRMLDDYTMANNQARGIANLKGWTVPSTLSTQSNSALGLLARTKSNFGRAFMSEQLKYYRKNVALYKKEATTGYDDTTKTYAINMLPKLQTHLKEVQTFLHPTRGSITPANTLQIPNSRPDGTHTNGDAGTNNNTNSGTRTSGGK